MESRNDINQVIHMPRLRDGAKVVSQIVPVILCGGSGTRLWPLSRRHNPKQFLKLLGEYSLFQETVKRARIVCSSRQLIVATGYEHRKVVMDEIEEIAAVGNDLRVLVESSGRNTAPALAAAALQIAKTAGEALLLVMPADHLISDHEALKLAVQSGAHAARRGAIVAFGVKPLYACTEYGYMLKGLPGELTDTFKIAAFREKPDRQTAEKYVMDGGYLWNCGIFLTRADSYLEKLSRYAPEVFVNAGRAFDLARHDGRFINLDRESFEKCPNISIDYAVMERTDSACVVQFNGEWTDLGTWESLHGVSAKTSEGNAVCGDVVLRDVKNSYIRSGRRLVTAIGLRNQLIVDTPDALLVADMNGSEQMKQLVAELERQQRPEVVQGSMHQQSWGWRERLTAGQDAEVWELCLRPGMHVDGSSLTFHSLSWTVVKGEGEVTVGAERHNLKSGRAVSIGSVTEYTLRNVGSGPFQIIEVRSGNADAVQGL